MQKRQFKPSLLPTVLTLLLVVIFISLGTWQINRSVEKQSLMDSFDLAPEMKPVAIADLDTDWERYRFRKIHLQGSYDSDHQILLENQFMNRRSGYMVITPFKLEGIDSYVLVNRGWVARKQGQTILPDVSLQGNIQEVHGLVSHPPGVGMQIGSLDQSPMGWPKPVPYLDINWMALQLGASFSPWIVLLNENQDEGYIRSWKPAIAVRMPPEKHQSYAFQWYSLAIAVFVLFVIGSLKSEGDTKHDD